MFAIHVIISNILTVNLDMGGMATNLNISAAIQLQVKSKVASRVQHTWEQARWLGIKHWAMVLWRSVWFCVLFFVLSIELINSLFISFLSVLRWGPITEDVGRFGQWSSADRFKTSVVYVGQIDQSYKISALGLCAPGAFPRALTAGLESTALDIVFAVDSWLDLVHCLKI